MLRLNLYGDNQNWMNMNSMLQARARFSSVVHDDKEIFVLPDGGGDTFMPNSDQIEMYNIDTNQWTALNAKIGWAATAVGVGNVAWISVIASTPRIYKLDMESWEVSGPINMHFPRKYQVKDARGCK